MIRSFAAARKSLRVQPQQRVCADETAAGTAVLSRKPYNDDHNV